MKEKALFLVVSVFLVISLLPSTSSGAGTVKLNPGASITLNSADLSGQGGGCQFPKINCGGASAAGSGSLVSPTEVNYLDDANPNGVWSLGGDWWDNSISSFKIE